MKSPMRTSLGTSELDTKSPKAALRAEGRIPKEHLRAIDKDHQVMIFKSPALTRF